MDKTYSIEYVYKIWDTVNGDYVTIQQGDDEGIFEIGTTMVTVEQIPGIIEVLSKLKAEFDAKMMDGPACKTSDFFTPEKMAIERQRMLNENRRSGRSDHPF